MTVAEMIAAIGEVSRRVGSVEGKLDGLIETVEDLARRTRSIEDAATADRAVASRVAAMRAEGTITKRWVINTLIAFVVAIATVAGLAIAIASQVIK